MASTAPYDQPNQHNNFGRGRGGYRGCSRGGRGGRDGPGDRGGFGARGGRIGKSHDGRTCHFCGMPGLFIKFCRRRIVDKESSRNPRPNNDGAGNSQAHGNFKNSAQQAQQHQNYGNSGYQGQPSAHFNANIVQGNPAPAPDAPPPFFNQGQYNARIARKASKIVTTSDKKSYDSFIDSGS